jgi:hypothetical protein
VAIDIPQGFHGDLRVHIHPDTGRPISRSSIGAVAENTVTLTRELLASAPHFEIEIS